MKEYLAKQKELDELIQMEVARIVGDLIQWNVGKTAYDLRRAALDYIREKRVPTIIGGKVRNEIDNFISRIKIPVQKKEMLAELEELIINEAKRLKSKKLGASPAEMKALAELVHAVNQAPRTVEVFDSSLACELKKSIENLT